MVYTKDWLVGWWITLGGLQNIEGKHLMGFARLARPRLACANLGHPYGSVANVGLILTITFSWSF